MSHNLTAITSVSKTTGIHTFHMIGTCPQTNMFDTLHIYFPLHYCCSQHIELTLLCTKVKKDKICDLIVMLLPYLCQHQIWYLNATNTKLVHVHIWDNCVHILTLFELPAVNSGTRSTAIDTVHIIGVCSEQICLPYCMPMSHCTASVIYIQMLHYCMYK